MTKEQKELLLKDLCARLPYGVQCEVGGRRYGPYTFVSDDVEDLMEGRMFKPYLRSMSSMTEEEARDYANCGNLIAFSLQKDYLIPNPNSTDWLNKNHFDYRGLIPMGLAIEVTEENNPYKD